MSKSGFDIQAFNRAQFQPRTAEILVPALQQFFGDNKPIWIVRGLTSSELAKTMEATARNLNLDKIIQAIGDNKAEINNVREALGLGDATPKEVVKRIEQLLIGSVDPIMDRHTVVKLAETFPIEFLQLTTEILNLTGLGMEIKKPKPSGENEILEI